MSGRILGTVLCTGFLMAALVQPGEIRGAVKPKPGVERDQPIEIVSDRMDAYHEKRMVVFSGNAVAKQGERTIRSDRLILYYREDRQAAVVPARETGGVGSLERVEAKGKVAITEGERIVTGDEAVFEQDSQKITMTGNAVLREGANVVQGDRIVVFLEENRGVVESAERSRVKATIYPAEKQEKR